LAYAASAEFDIESNFGEKTTTVIGMKKINTRKNKIFYMKKYLPEE
jgi:hypothetical protein